MAECPHRGALNALEVSQQDGSQRNSPIDNSTNEVAQMGFIHFLSALQSQLRNLKKEPEKELMHVDLLVNGNASRALVDTGTTDTYISPVGARSCGLAIAKDVGKMKAVNSATSSICEGAKKVLIKERPWEGSVHFTVTSMDDFDMVLRLHFMISAQAISVSATSCLLFLGESLCVAAATILPHSGTMFSTIQFKKGLRKCEPSFVVLPICTDSSVIGTKPPARCPYRMSPPELAELRKQLDELLQLCKAKYFTKLDLKLDYHQVRIAEGDEPKTTCVTRYGIFEFLVMPFGLTNASATFCTLMNQVFYDYLEKFVVIYLDHVMVYSSSLREHEDHLRLVMERLRENQLFVKCEKCEFAPKWFVVGYSCKTLVLISLLRKGEKWAWSKECQEAFGELKATIRSDPILALPDLERPLEVETDLSKYAIGVVLIQNGHPIAFESRKLSGAETRCTTQEKELRAVIHCLRAWRHYLLGSKFLVWIDNTANSHFLTQPKLTARQTRW
ncbi:hypothetical protein V6N13_083151 [Hibiscus sabdariffa]